MGKRFQHTEKSIKTRIKEGRGTGEGGTYKPWILIQDFPSFGRCHRIFNYRVNRIHHFFSDLEEKVFYLYWWSNKVLDIREQFPLLPQEETIAIANELGIKHPIDPQTSYPTVLTTDFLLKTSNRSGETYLARTAKYKSALKNQRTLEKFEIERVFWERRNIDWKIVTEESIPLQRFQNIKLIFPFYQKDSVSLPPMQFYESSIWLTEKVLDNQKNLRIISNFCDQKFSYQSGFSMNIIFHLISQKHWKPNLDSQLLTLRKSQILPDEVAPNFLNRIFHGGFDK